MRVFVTGTGRCGTTTLYYACRHITNYVAESEGNHPDLKYPDNGIYIDPNMWAVLPILTEVYPDDIFVRLWRKPEECIRSLAKLPARQGGYVMDWYQCFWSTVYPKGERVQCAGRLEALVEDVCLRHCNMTIRLNRMPSDMDRFWKAIEATGDIEAARDEWRTKYNSGKEQGHQ